MNGEQQKFKSLDGLRGLAALVVVLFHYCLAFTPFLLGSAGATHYHTKLDHLVATTPLYLPLAGSFAVCIFFVLSGFVLSISFFKHRSIDVLISSAARRYFRLMFPALVSILLAFVVLGLGLMYTKHTGELTQSLSIGRLWNFPAHLLTALYQGFYWVFFSSSIGSASSNLGYNPVLWTMHFELFGSFLVFMFLALFGKMNNRWFFYALLSLAFLKSYYLAFILGVAICDIVFNYPRIKEVFSPKIVVAVLPIGLILGSWKTSGVYPSLYSHLHLPLFTAAELELFAQVIGAAIVLIAVLRLSALGKVFETRFMQFLGKISFSLYLTHLIILGSLAGYLFSALYPMYGYKISVLMAFVLSMTVTFVVSALFTRFVDVPSIALSKKIGNFLVGGNIGQSIKKLRGRRLVPVLYANKLRRVTSLLVTSSEE